MSTKSPRLVELADVILCEVSRVARIARLFDAIATVAEQQTEPMSFLVEDDQKSIKEYLEGCLPLLRQLDLFKTIAIVEAILPDLDSQSHSAISTSAKLLRVVYDKELAEHTYFKLTAFNQTFFELESPLGAATELFLAAKDDAREAGTCFALGRHTASVFHAMRVLEHGIMAMAIDVGKVYESQNWHNIIDEIEKAIRLLEKCQQSEPLKLRIKVLSGAAIEMRHFKNAWRNHVSHAKAPYDALNAQSILLHVQAFMVRLSAGLPLETLEQAAVAMMARQSAP